MAVTVTLAAASTRLTTLPRLKRELNLTSVGDDKILWDLIQQMSDLIVRKTQRTFALERVTEKLPAKGGLKIVLERVPIVTIHDVKFNGSTVSSTSYSIDNADAGILFRDIGWTTTQLFTHDITRIPLSEGRRHWEFDYTAGYITPGLLSTAGDPNLPADIERACLDLTKMNYLRKEDDPGIQSQRTGDASETRFGTAQSGFPPAITEILREWTRIDPI